jgi:hypothetical protein
MRQVWGVADTRSRPCTADLAAPVAIENKGQGTPIVPKPESRGGQPAAPAPEDEAAEPRGKIGFDGQGGIGEGRLLGHAERRGPDSGGKPAPP